MNRRKRLSLALLLVVFAATFGATRQESRAQSGGPDFPVPNVIWSLKDSISACPAGDSVIAGHPAQLRIRVEYNDANFDARPDVPPDSIWVTLSTVVGNAAANDEGQKTHAADTTDANGETRVIIPSLSGEGTLRVTLYVSGVSQGYGDARLKSTDVDADSEQRTTTSDTTSGCDIDWSRSTNQSDRNIIAEHLDHWHRNALHGTLVQRTSQSYVENGPNSLGESQVFWSGSQNWLSYTVHENESNCHIYIVAASPSGGNTPRLFAYLADTSDYDPSWSPLNTEIAFGRHDYKIVRKGIPGFSSDTTAYVVAASGGPTVHGDLTPAISPYGQWVAFSRLTDATAYHIWKVPITGGQPTQLTFTEGAGEQYPSWTPDGEWILFDRGFNGGGGQHHAYKVKANQIQTADTLTSPVYRAPTGTDAATPACSPDGLIVTFGKGTHDSSTVDVRTYTLDHKLSTPKPILNYPDTAFALHGPDPVLSPHLSPDGTRLALVSRQIWAARRNMDLPPRITQVTWLSNSTNTSIDDTTTVYEKSAIVLLDNCYQLSATDPESDSLAWFADVLAPGMTFDPDTRTLCFDAPTTGDFYYGRIRVSEHSGGSDYLIMKLKVLNSDGPLTSSKVLEEAATPVIGPNPTTGAFIFPTLGSRGTPVTAAVWDLAGRHIASVKGRAGTPLVWNGRGIDGTLASPGIYLYRVESQAERREGKVVVCR